MLHQKNVLSEKTRLEALYLGRLWQFVCWTLDGWMAGSKSGHLANP